jgi:hypothetical protein
MEFFNRRWSAKEGDIPYGDPDLHHSIGVFLAGGHSIPSLCADRQKTKSTLQNATFFSAPNRHPQYSQNFSMITSSKIPHTQQEYTFPVPYYPICVSKISEMLEFPCQHLLICLSLEKMSPLIVQLRVLRFFPRCHLSIF